MAAIEPAKSCTANPPSRTSAGALVISFRNSSAHSPLHVRGTIENIRRVLAIFLDKDVKVDLNKAATQLEQMSPDAMPGGAADPLKPGALPGAAGDSKAAEQEQQNIDDLFKDANKK